MTIQYNIDCDIYPYSIYIYVCVCVYIYMCICRCIYGCQCVCAYYVNIIHHYVSVFYFEYVQIDWEWLHNNVIVSIFVHICHSNKDISINQIQHEYSFWATHGIFRCRMSSYHWVNMKQQICCAILLPNRYSQHTELCL